MSIKEQDQAIEKHRAIREAFVKIFAPKIVFKRGRGFICYSCLFNKPPGSREQVTWTWHWTGFTFHKECLPKNDDFCLKPLEDYPLMDPE